MSEFAALCAAVVRDTVFDVTAALAVADYLNERDDERGTRLRRRVQKHEREVRHQHKRLEWCVSHGYETWAAEHEHRIRHQTSTITEYFFRLTSIGSGDPLPRKRIGWAWPLVEPGATSRRAA